MHTLTRLNHILPNGWFKFSRTDFLFVCQILLFRIFDQPNTTSQITSYMYWSWLVRHPAALPAPEAQLGT